MPHVQNEDGTSVPIVLDKVIKIRHFGREIGFVILKMLELGKLPEHVHNAVEVIKLMKTQKRSTKKSMLKFFQTIPTTYFNSMED